MYGLKTYNTETHGHAKLPKGLLCLDTEDKKPPKTKYSLKQLNSVHAPTCDSIMLSLQV